MAGIWWRLVIGFGCVGADGKGQWFRLQVAGELAGFGWFTAAAQLVHAELVEFWTMEVGEFGGGVG